MAVLKPIRGTQINKSHPLTQGLVGSWLFNEGTGGKAFDLSRNGNVGTLYDGVSWTAGKFGACLEFDDTGDYVNYAANETLDFRTKPFTLIAWVNYNSGSPSVHYIFEGAYTKPLWIILDSSNTVDLRLRNSADTGVDSYPGTAGAVSPGVWWNLGVTYDRQYVRHYINGILDVASARTGDMGGAAPTAYGIGGRPPDAFNGLIGSVFVFNRALSAPEIALLYREPFCIFERAGRTGWTGGQIVNLAGTSAALSSLSATAKTVRKVAGNIACISNITALLNPIKNLPETEWNWTREALFNGMTANALKLGTSLSLGWFWFRISGCSALYRGPGMEEIDFVNILAVSEQVAPEISPPVYISHNNGSIHFYVIRRFNSCGYQERTLAAAVKVSIESNGELAESRPNNIYSSEVQQVDGNKIQLVWFYCPLAQKSQPECFNVYYDDRTGQIDYENPLASIGYKGRKFYSFQSSALEAGKYLFAIRAEDKEGLENNSLVQLQIQIDTASLDTLSIISAEAV